MNLNIVVNDHEERIKQLELRIELLTDKLVALALKDKPIPPPKKDGVQW